MNDPLPPATRDAYLTLTQSAGYCELPGRAQIELTGGDRASFLHNLCTHDIKRLQAGGGCEAFLCNVQGKILGYLFVFCTPDSLVLDSAAGQNERLMQHLDRYLIREDVTLQDRTESWSEYLLSGPQAVDILASLGVEHSPTGYLDHVPAEIDGSEVFLRRTDWTAETAFFIAGARTTLPAVADALQSAGARPVEAAAVELARVERGSPIYQVDISEQNLPQEVHRDALAISFVKGCYLGQETVARIDALGHVNWTLLGLRGEVQGRVPDELSPGAELQQDGKTAARVTSVVYSPRLNAPLALAYVRRGFERPGTVLEAGGAKLTVVSLPLTDPPDSPPAG